MTNARQELIDGLNEDLKGEFQAIIMDRLYAKHGEGPVPPGAPHVLRQRDSRRAGSRADAGRQDLRVGRHARA